MNKFQTKKPMTRKTPQTADRNRREEYGVFGKLERKSEKDKQRDEARREREGQWPGWG